MTRVIVVEVEGRMIGMVVDSASQVVRIPADQIDPPPPMLGGFSQEFITGVGKLDDKLIILLNTDAILTMEEMSALSTIDKTADTPSAQSAGYGGAL
jgi:purine-binding chemotaxis protein CheW